MNKYFLFALLLFAANNSLLAQNNADTYLVSGKDMSSQMKYIHSRGGKILSITEVM